MDHGTEMPEFNDTRADIATKFNFLVWAYYPKYIISIPRLTSG